MQSGGHEQIQLVALQIHATRLRHGGDRSPVSGAETRLVRVSDAPGPLPQFDAIAQVLAGEDARIGGTADGNFVNVGGVRGASRAELNLHLARVAIANGGCDSGAWVANGAPEQFAVSKCSILSAISRLSSSLRVMVIVSSALSWHGVC